MNETDKILKLFPTAICVSSKKINGINHYLILDRRPSVLSIDVNCIEESVYLVLPSDFSHRLFEHSFYYPLVFDLATTGRIHFDFDNRANSLRLFFCSNLLMNTYDIPTPLETTFKKLSHLTDYLRHMHGATHETCLNENLQNYLSEIYFNKIAVTGFAIPYVIQSGSIPNRISNKLSKKLSKKENVLLVEDLKTLVKVNSDQRRRNTLFYFVELKEDFEEVVLCLLQNCKEEIQYLIKQYRFFYWYDTRENLLILKVEISNKENHELNGLLNKINRKLVALVGKGILKFTEEELRKHREEYSRIYLSAKNAESILLNYSINFIDNSEVDMSVKTFLHLFLKIAIELIDKIEIKVTEQFWGSFFFSCRLEYYCQVKRKNLYQLYVMLQKEQRQLESRFEMNRIVEFAEMVVLVKKSQQGNRHFEEISNQFLNTVEEFIANDTFEFVTDGCMDCLGLNQALSGSDLFLLRQLKSLFDFIAKHLGISGKEKIYATYALNRLFEEEKYVLP